MAEIKGVNKLSVFKSESIPTFIVKFNDVPVPTTFLKCDIHWKPEIFFVF